MSENNFLRRTVRALTALGVVASGALEEVKAQPVAGEKNKVGRTEVRSEEEQKEFADKARKEANAIRREFDETGVEKPSPFELEEVDLVEAEKEHRKEGVLSVEEVKEIHPDYEPVEDDKPFTGINPTSTERTKIKRDLPKVAPEESAKMDAELERIKQEAYEAAEKASDNKPVKTEPRFDQELPPIKIND